MGEKTPNNSAINNGCVDTDIITIKATKRSATDQLKQRRPRTSSQIANALSEAVRFATLLLVITHQCRPCGATVCDSFGAKYRTDIQKLLDSVFTYRKLNLVILLDVSASIGRDLYRREVETFAVDLVEYGIRKSGLIIHPDYATIELMTFDDLAEIQVVYGEKREASRF